MYEFSPSWMTYGLVGISTFSPPLEMQFSNFYSVYCRSTVHSNTIPPNTQTTSVSCENRQVIEEASKKVTDAISGNPKIARPPPRVPTGMNDFYSAFTSAFFWSSGICHTKNYFACFSVLPLCLPYVALVIENWYWDPHCWRLISLGHSLAWNGENTFAYIGHCWVDLYGL